MGTTRPERGEGIYDGFPSPPLLIPAGSPLRWIRNGQPAVGGAVRQLERAGIHLGARRKNWFAQFGGEPRLTTVAAPSQVPLGRLPVEPYTKFCSAYILYSTSRTNASVVFSLITSYGTYSAAAGSTAAQTRVAAQYGVVRGVVIGTNAATDLAWVNIELGVTMDGKAAGDTCAVYGVTLYPEDPEEITF